MNAGISWRVIWMGASRLTRNARSTCSEVKPSSLPDAGNPAFAAQDVDLTRLGQQPQRRAILGEVTHDRPVAASGQRGGEPGRARRVCASSG